MSDVLPSQSNTKSMKIKFKKKLGSYGSDRENLIQQHVITVMKFN